MTFVGEHTRFLVERLKRGQVVLVLGAGANFGGVDRYKNPIKDGKSFAKLLAEALGYEYSDEPLTEVVSAYINKIGTDAFINVLQNNFQRTMPSKSIASILNYTWKRIYTWNIDDSIELAARRSPQRLKSYNGMGDGVEDDNGLDILQLIRLHGSVDHPQKGFIFSEQEYASALQANGHPWYHKLAEDYRAFTPVFIGTSLSEPVLSAEIERARRQRGGKAGLAFLITPDNFSDIRIAALQQREICHLKGGVDDFAKFLEENLGAQWTPRQSLALTTPFNEATLSQITKSELAAAQYVRKVDISRAKSDFVAKSPTIQGVEARNFLRGFPPTWQVASSQIPIPINAAKPLKQHIIGSIQQHIPLHVTVGPAGSGKTTELMAALAEIALDGNYEIYEVAAELNSIVDLISVLSKTSDKEKIVYLPVLYIFSGIISDHLTFARRHGITFVSTARSSEWGSHLENLFSQSCSTFEIARFDSNDYDQLIDRLTKFVPAPRFIQLSHEEKRNRLKRASGQLLVALREVTESKTFDEVIIDEYDRISSELAKRIFIIIGFATLARVGVREEVIREAIGSNIDGDQFDEAMSSLDGIVYESSTGRQFIRHELYVRKVFERSVSAKQLVAEYIELLGTYVKYKMPIMRNVSRPDGLLFRFLINHHFVGETCAINGSQRDGRRIFEAYAVPFQLDGHFWLQYGLFISDLGDFDGALALLAKSIEAFPGNLYAKHALAAMQLRSAAERPSFDATTRKQIDSAVVSLRELIAAPNLKSDSFPLVTLALRHTGTLLKHARVDDATAVAKEYLAELQRAERNSSAAPISQTKECIFRFLTLGTWDPPTLFRDGLSRS